MSKRIAAAAVMASVVGVTTPAVAGTTEAFSFLPSGTTVVTALSNPVTYSTPASGKKAAMQTYIGLQVGDVATGLLMKNTSGNTVNNASIKFTATVTDPEETITLHQPEIYLPAGCSWDTAAANAKSFTCNFGQLKNGDSVPAFTVFYVAPQKVCQTVGSNLCGGVGDADNSDFISTNLQVVYSEGLNGPPTVWDNSNQTVPQANVVTLGTFNPVNIKSAVPKSGAKVYTGSGGVPVPETPAVPNAQFAELLTIPSLTGAYTVAELQIDRFTEALDLANCANGGRFTVCPTFRTTVANNGNETRFLDPANPLRWVYRVDASNLKLSGPKILNSTSILYTGKKFGEDGITEVLPGWVDEPLKMCLVKDTVNSTNGLPCINSSKCYKKNDTGGIPDLEGDCEWELLNTANGFGKIQ